jgi:hypothetical protein
MSFIFIVVLRTRKRLTPKDVAAVKGLSMFGQHILALYGYIKLSNLQLICNLNRFIIKYKSDWKYLAVKGDFSVMRIAHARGIGPHA